MLLQVASYPAHFVHLRGWTEFDHRIAFVTDYIPIEQRHFVPISVQQVLLYARKLLQVLLLICHSLSEFNPGTCFAS